MLDLKKKNNLKSSNILIRFSGLYVSNRSSVD